MLIIVDGRDIAGQDSYAYVAVHVLGVYRCSRLHFLRRSVVQTGATSWTTQTDHHQL